MHGQSGGAAAAPDMPLGAPVWGLMGPALCTSPCLGRAGVRACSSSSSSSLGKLHRNARSLAVVTGSCCAEAGAQNLMEGSCTWQHRVGVSMQAEECRCFGSGLLQP